MNDLTTVEKQFIVTLANNHLLFLENIDTIISDRFGEAIAHITDEPEIDSPKVKNVVLQMAAGKEKQIDLIRSILYKISIIN
jgi:hypothetical protein